MTDLATIAAEMTLYDVWVFNDEELFWSSQHPNREEAIEELKLMDAEGFVMEASQDFDPRIDFDKRIYRDGFSPSHAYDIIQTGQTYSHKPG